MTNSTRTATGLQLLFPERSDVRAHLAPAVDDLFDQLHTFSATDAPISTLRELL